MSGPQAPRPTYRFAPSPNGHLHLGHALSALLNYREAKRTNGRFLLRIEDIDTTRCTPAMEHDMLEDLKWLGISWDKEPRRQSEHFVDYEAAIEKLDALDLIYPAFLTRSEIRRFVEIYEEETGPWPRDPDGAPIFPGDMASLSTGEIANRTAEAAPFALRLDMKAALRKLGHSVTWQEQRSDGTTERVKALPQAWGDVVLARKETPTSYHLSVVVDDALQGVTHVLRGRDLYQATAVHRVLQELLGLPEPVYRHHRLIMGPDGRKLSKSEASTSLRALRKAGVTRRDILEKIGLADDEAEV